MSIRLFRKIRRRDKRCLAAATWSPFRAVLSALLLVALLLSVHPGASAEPAKLDGRYVQDWCVLAPMRTDVDEDLRAAAQFPFDQLDPVPGQTYTDARGETVQWRQYPSFKELLPASDLLNGKDTGQVLLYCELMADEDTEAVLFLSISKEMPVCIAINQEVHSFPKPPWLFRLNSKRLRVSLHSGINRCFVLGICKSRDASFALRALPLNASAKASVLPLRSMDHGPVKGCFLFPERIREGDDPAWSSPELDDSTWQPYDPSDIDRRPFAPLTEASEVVWFRFRLRVDPAYMDIPVVLEEYPYDRSIDVFVDGVKKRPPHYLRSPWPDFPRSFRLPKEETVVAIRWNRSEAGVDTQRPGFELLAHTYGEATNSFVTGLTVERTHAIHRIVLISLFSVFLLFHATLFAYLPKRREYLLFCLTLASCLAAILSIHVSETTTSVTLWRLAYARAFLGFTLLSVLMGLALLQKMLTNRLSPSLYFYAILASGCYAAVLMDKTPWAHIFPVIVAPEVMRTCWLGLKRRQSGALPLVVFAASLVVLMSVHSIGGFYGWSDENPFLRNASWYAFAVFAMLVALLLARDFSRATRKLETFSEELEQQVQLRTAALKEALDNVKTLSGLLPICAACKRIRDDKGYWNRIEAYISSHSEAKFTHGLCPECLKERHPEFYEREFGSKGN